MDVTRLPVYRTLAKQTTPHGRRKLRRYLRGDYKGAKARVLKLLKPFAGMKLEDCKEQVKEVLLKMTEFNTRHAITMQNHSILLQFDMSKPFKVQPAECDRLIITGVIVDELTDKN